MNTTTWAIIADAYRDLNSRKMFWIVLWLSVIAILAFALVGTNGHSFSILWWQMPQEFPNAQLVYKQVFSSLVIGFYFTFIATVLALISTASIFPEFMASGSVDLYLSKPVGRVRLFLTKYFAGLLFVALQVTVFTVGSFLVLGLRGHQWVPSLFLAIPIVVCFFSYLYGICVLLGVMTRSTLASLLLTILAWFFIWSLDSTDRVLTALVESAPMMQRQAQRQMERLDERIAERKAQEHVATQHASAGGSGDESELARMKAERDAYAARAKDSSPAPMVVTMQKLVVGLKTFVPKTRETTALLDRYLLPDAEIETAMNRDNDDTQPAMGVDVIDPMRKRSVWWVVGSSLGFEALVVGLAAWIFKRRDF